jgi:coniferyl-aldehyde dehydrogenase
MNSIADINPSIAESVEQAEAIRTSMQVKLDEMRRAYHQAPSPSLAERKHDLKQLKRLIGDNTESISQAISRDYGHRSEHETMFAELIGTGGSIDDILKNLKSWMKPEKRHIDATMFPFASNTVIPQPLGVVGLIVPWNFPVFLAVSQIATAFAAGNRVMVKMSENSRHLTRLLRELAPQYLPEDKLTFLEETGGVGIEFSKLAFDLIIFTGSGATGKKVMASAAENLTPVILELGGKSPAIIDPKYDLAKAAERIMFAKQFNAGQICVNVDYVMVHASQADEFIERCSEWLKSNVPTIDSDDYTSMIDQRAYDRMMATLEDARNYGATIINPTGEAPNPETRKVPVQFIVNTSPEMVIRNRETFGPLLMIVTYESPDDVIAHVNSGDRPLAMYPFTRDKKLADLYIERIMSGGVSINDALLHVSQHDLPFGGVGGSGMGHYHGKEGFNSCSKMRPVFHQANFTINKFLAPPYTGMKDKIYRFLTKKSLK